MLKDYKRKFNKKTKKTKDIEIKCEILFFAKVFLKRSCNFGISKCF